MVVAIRGATVSERKKKACGSRTSWRGWGKTNPTVYRLSLQTRQGWSSPVAEEKTKWPRHWVKEEIRRTTETGARVGGGDRGEGKLRFTRTTVHTVRRWWQKKKKNDIRTTLSDRKEHSQLFACRSCKTIDLIAHPWEDGFYSVRRETEACPTDPINEEVGVEYLSSRLRYKQ